ncbi:hypothetical protein [Ramlibacter sp.]|uniref:hypothetical protein n=1 Tax=Ramlibacter sp. TaxID=1917967 RepID=UPI0035AE1A08
MDEPRDILHAARHPSPYAWYDRLRAGPPVQREAASGLWIVCGPRAVRAALRHPALRVRPQDEPVPKVLLHTAAGDSFAGLARMNDGDTHAALRLHVEHPMARWTADSIDQAARRAALDLAPRTDADAWIHAVPAQAVARLLRVPDARLDTMVADVQAFVRGIAPGASGQDAAEASEAASRLRAAMGATALSMAAVANRIALMQQAVDATAGLLGNTLVRLHAPPDAAVTDLAALVADVAQHDPAIHHTRRWAAQPLTLGGASLAAGDAVVILLAGTAPFGAGPHACPGEALSLRIATAALQALQGMDRLGSFAGPARGWRPLANARIPVFAA